MHEMVKNKNATMQI